MPDPDARAPLAARMRPASLDGFVGQEHLIGPGRVLRKSIEADNVPSMVLWGPPGSGKTTLARIIAGLTQASFAQISAVSSGVADLRRIVQEAQERDRAMGGRTILFIDEIHRFNKAQQDAILPFVEDGTVTFIGATTENPSFEIISPLLSRARVFRLNPLDRDQVRRIVHRAVEDRERGLGDMNVKLADDAEPFLLEIANGDARVALNALELAAAATRPDDGGRRVVTLATLEDAVQGRSLRYDKAGDEHYDTISAFIKSLRGSDPDAAVYWLARMLEAGEDPLFVARRLVILAAEDMGLADPHALRVAVAAQQAVHFIGMPEGFLPLAEATLYLATAPKSNSALEAYRRAKQDVEQSGNEPVPLHLRNAVTGLMREMGYGKDYKYAHRFSEHQVEQQHLPERLKGRRYYEPGDQGFEAEIAERLRRWGKRPGREGT
ncbi:MAG: replication-associated recombination protein A [Dehalococcoidia bacterium]